MYFVSYTFPVAQLGHFSVVWVHHLPGRELNNINPFWGWFYCVIVLLCSEILIEMMMKKKSVKTQQIMGVPRLHENDWHGFQYHGFWLMYVQWGNFCISRGFTTVPLTQILRNTIFSKSQNASMAGTLCNGCVQFWGAVSAHRGVAENHNTFLKLQDWKCMVKNSYSVLKSW